MTTGTLASRRTAAATLLLWLGAFAGCSTGPSSGGSVLEMLDEPRAQRVGDALERYRSAYETQDMERLREAWEMSSIDALLLEQAWQSCELLNVSVESVEIELKEREASASFDQVIDYRCETRDATSRLLLRAGLAEQADGSWKILRFTRRTTAPERVRATSRAPVSATSSAPPLDALHAYQSALQACDVEALSRTWVMSARDRDLFARFCERSEKVSVSIEQQDVDLQGDRGEVQFAQTVTAERGGQICETNATLRASLVKRESGDWSMLNLRPVQ
jgi:hypothetical protein